MEVTDKGLIFGTPHYMSPEQGHGKEIDARSDVYALGVMLFEMLTGKKPYDAENHMAILVHHAKAPIPKLPERLAPLQPLIDTLMAKDVAGRPESAEAAARQIDLILAAQSAPDPAAAAAAAAAAAPTPAPAPASAPEPAAASAPAPAPEPAVASAPAPEPAVASAPEPAPEPSAEPVQAHSPESAPESAPAPASDSAPEPAA
jgi:serine/threonine-protein kinase PpkA